MEVAVAFGNGDAAALMRIRCQAFWEPTLALRAGGVLSAIVFRRRKTGTRRGFRGRLFPGFTATRVGSVRALRGLRHTEAARFSGCLTPE